MKKIFISLVLCLSFSLLKSQTEVTFYTTKGVFVVEIYDNIVPITGGNFLDLVDKKFYDGVIFHRVINNFMIQGGDPTGTGSGGPGYTIPDEFDSTLSNIQKTISMANAGPNTGGSQFFINLVNNTYLDYNKAPLSSAHPVFGMVVMNFNVVQTIGAVATNSSDRPLVDVVMDSIRRGNGLTVGLQKLESNEFELSAFPNPITDMSVLTVDAKKNTSASVSLTDIFGRQVAFRNVELKEGNNRIDLSDLIQSNEAPGLYVLNLMIDGQVLTVRLTKQ